LSTLNNSTDEIMKRLTVISCIFTPLVLLTSIWGMSEWSMMTGTSKESWILQYAGFFLFMGVIAVITYLLMRWRRWI
ncbi:MAG: CorA family divalent cation transporter, partial [Thermoplasmata archaeon]